MRTAVKLLAGTLTSSGAITRAWTKLLSGTLSTAGALTRQAQHILGGALASTGSIIRRTGKALSGLVASSGVLVRGRLYVRILGGVLTTAGNVTASKLAIVVRRIIRLLAEFGIIQNISGEMGNNYDLDGEI